MNVLILAALAVFLLFLASIAAVIVERRADALKRARTLELLGLLHAVLSHAKVHPLPNNDSWHEALQLALDWREKRSLSGEEPPGWEFGPDDRRLLDLLCQASFLVDAWGQPLHYRSPGPAHPEGWDVFSVGPKGDTRPDPGLIRGADLGPA